MYLGDTAPNGSTAPIGPARSAYTVFDRTDLIVGPRPHAVEL